MPAIMCVQRKAAKKAPTEADLAYSNKKGFGDEIGKITNRITEMFDVRSRFPEDSEEYRVLTYRIATGQKFQQDQIDSLKGIVTTPMPKHWYRRSACDNDFDRSIVADKKPLFMTHIYTSLSTNNNELYSRMKCNLWLTRRVDIDALLNKSEDEMTAEEAALAKEVREILPVSTGQCVTNRIFRIIEGSFSAKNKLGPTEDVPEHFVPPQCKNTALLGKIRELHKQYEALCKDTALAAREYRMERKEPVAKMFDALSTSVSRACQELCSNRDELCEALLHYGQGSAAKGAFVWQTAGRDIVEYLLEKNGGRWRRPVEREDGAYSFAGKKFDIEIMTEVNGHEECDSAE